MKRKVRTLISAMVLTAIATSPALAQGAPPAGGQAGGRGQAPAPAPQNIDLATATKIAVAAEAAAAAANAKVCIAIYDANGDLVLFRRMDGAAARAVTASQGKARAVLLFGLPTREVSEAAAAGRQIPAGGIKAPPPGPVEILLFQGGLPIMKDGKLVGAIGVGGSTAPADEGFAQAGLDAAK